MLFLIKDPDQAEDVEGNEEIMDAMDGGEKKSDQYSFEKEGDMIKVIFSN